MRKKVLAFLLLLAMAVPGSLLADTLESVYFRGNMSPANEVPAVTNESAAATGKATIGLHLRRNDAGAIISGVVDFDIDYNFPVPVTVRGLHIHEGGVGVNGPVRIDTGLSANATQDLSGRGNLFRQVVVTSGDALTALGGVLANPAGWYVNLHTTVNTGGLMRDQLKRMYMTVVRAEMSPANEVPPIAGLNASAAGSATILYTVDNNGYALEGTVRYDVNYNFPGTVTFTGLHIHPGAAGANGPARMNTPVSAANSVTDADGVGSLSYKVEVALQNDLDALRLLLANPANLYMNLHTTDNTGGAVRGQLQPTSQIDYQLLMSPANEVPPIADLNASALAKASLFTSRDAAGQVTGGTVIFDANYNFPGSVTFRGFHIHDGAAGVNGPVRIDSGLSATNTLTDEDGAGNLNFRINVGAENALGLATLRSAVATPENHYLNLHTTVNTGGAVRSQLSGTLAAPAILTSGIVNATFAGGVNAAAPGSLISIFGSNLARGTAGAYVANGRVATNVAGTEVRVGTTPAPLLYVSPTQINAQVPFEAAAGAVNVTTITSAGTSTAQTLTVSAFAPAIFVVVKSTDFSPVSAANPARAGDVLLIYATGLGAGAPPVATGGLAPANPLSATAASTTVSLGAATLTPGSSVLAPGFAGLYQVNVTVPAGTAAGSYPLRLTIGGASSNTVNINVQ